MNKKEYAALTGIDDVTWRRRVAHAFGRAAPCYVDRASAQLSMGHILWQRLPSQAESVLDLGCGPGHWTVRLAQRYRLRPVGLDLSAGMLKEAQSHHGSVASWVCGDASALPLISHTFALVFSNLAIQWCRDQERLFSELHRVLLPGGRALINTLVPGTLAEIAHAWARPGRPTAINQFQPAHSVCEAARRAGFEVSQEQITERFYYSDIAAVMRSIKGVGAQTARSGPPLTRSDLALACERYETLRQPKGLPITYQRLTLELIRPSNQP